MSLWCTCRNMPVCEEPRCNYPAELTALVLASWKLPLRRKAQFFCAACFREFEAAWKKPIPGIDRPANADEEWRPSLMEMMRHARIAMDFEDRNKIRPIDEVPRGGRDPAWLAKVDRMFAGLSPMFQADRAT